MGHRVGGRLGMLDGRSTLSGGSQFPPSGVTARWCVLPLHEDTPRRRSRDPSEPRGGVEQGAQGHALVLGDWLASPTADGGLGLGTAGTSVIFLLAILATVVYLTRTRRDVTEQHQQHEATVARRPSRERAMLAYFGLVVVVAAIVLGRANAQPHAAAAAAEEDPTVSSAATAAPAPQLTPQQTTQHFPPAEIAKLRTITQETLSTLHAGDQAAATAKVKNLETAWDADQSSLQPLDDTAWHVLDGQVDKVLTALRAQNPDTTAEQNALNTLIQSLT